MQTKISQVMDAVEAVSSDWDREALRSFATNMVEGRGEAGALMDVDEKEKSAIRRAVDSVLRPVGSEATK